jgi:hypothetical protein
VKNDVNKVAREDSKFLVNLKAPVELKNEVEPEELDF